MPHHRRRSEEEYFVLEDVEKKHRLHDEKVREEKAHAKDDRKKQHFMKCPKCGFDLECIRIGLVDIDECRECGALVLNREDLDKLITEEKSLVKGFIEVFKKGE